MKEIKAIIKTFRLSAVIAALKEIDGLPGMTVDDSVRGFGRSAEDRLPDPNRVDIINYAEMAKIEIVIPDELVDIVTRTIQSEAHTGNPGDGKIFVYSVLDVVKIRTNERGEAAL